mmetsp:Transcript_60681/g.166630  ORF Transcript_60681/g.166630 Transcript_60681/m.166630 type:complete len:531 (-) Transcript_60681:200-1792(-)|eukprot:CAMPEP_0119531800 /NCGR_PEP_ID=MMETSP1344-20130328/45429_1 /TAXON_ID=236787 /ORGANISM="Florenciella parvula, Strain CCMP2471" /LENGTH=530 /DNA_ID=CAMNT_0007572141 /DNA_START=79 /DNA_END=1671 /DNA_ORIENTATION=+
MARRTADDIAKKPGAVTPVLTPGSNPLPSRFASGLSDRGGPHAEQKSEGSPRDAAPATLPSAANGGPGLGPGSGLKINGGDKNDAAVAAGGLGGLGAKIGGKLKGGWAKAATAKAQPTTPGVHHLGELVSRKGSVRVNLDDSLDKKHIDVDAIMHNKAQRAKKTLLGIGAHGGDAFRMKGVMANFQAAQGNKLGGTKLDLLAATRQLASKRSKDAQDEDDAMRTFTGDVFQQAAWCTLGLIGYVFNKMVCVWGHLPNDCIRNRGVLTVVDIQVLMVNTFVAGWFVDVTNDLRFSHLFNRKRWWFFVLYLASGVVWSSLSSTELASSVDADSELTGAQIAAYVGLGGVVVLVILWHLVYAYVTALHMIDEDEHPDHAMMNVLDWAGREFHMSAHWQFWWAYAGARLGVCLFYSYYILLMLTESNFHMHHWWVGWVLSLFGSFQHPISLAYLAITLGVFVQGIGAYSGDAIFAEDEGQILFSFERTYKPSTEFDEIANIETWQKWMCTLMINDCGNENSTSAEWSDCTDDGH